MDTQLLVACLALAAFVGAVAGYVAREIEGFDRPQDDVHSGDGDLERRSRRVQ